MGTLNAVSQNRFIFPALRNKYYIEKLETHISHSLKIFENFVIYDLMVKNTAERGRQQMTTWNIRIACWIPKATITHNQVV
jgi:hypothetical protein